MIMKAGIKRHGVHTRCPAELVEITLMEESDATDWVDFPDFRCREAENYLGVLTVIDCND